MPKPSNSKIDEAQPTPPIQEVGRQWTIKNLSPEIVHLTRDAAKRRGMKINAFINQALTRAVATHDGQIELAVEPSNPNREYQHIVKEIESLKESVNCLSGVIARMLASD